MKKALLFAAALALPLPAQAQPAMSRAVQQGWNAGFRDCAADLDAAVKFVHEDDQAYAHLGTWSKADANREAFNTVTSDRQSVTSFTGVKAASGKCDTVFTQIVPAQGKSCEALQTSELKDWKFLNELNGAAVFEDPGSPGINLILVATSKTSCLIVKQAVVYGG
jgi:hypothetical protein